MAEPNPGSTSTSLNAFLAVAGDVQVAKVTESEFLREAGADGIDMFY